MRRCKAWMCAAIVALGCVAPALGFADEATEAEPEQQAPAQEVQPVQQASSTNYFETTEEAAVPPVSLLSAKIEQPNDKEEVLATPACSPGCTGCASCSGCSSCCGPCCSLIAAAEATFFWPQFNRDFLQAGFSNNAGFVNVQTDAALGSTEGSMLVAPRITLGVQGPCWGILTRYWNASNWATGFSPAILNDPVPGITSFDGFRAQTWDVELQRRFGLGCWTMYGLGGVRWAGVDNDQYLNVIGQVNNEFYQSSAQTSMQFNGTGVTFGLLGTRPLFCENSPVKAFFANRYSFLWGTAAGVAQTTASMDNAGFAYTTNGAAYRNDRASMFIGEIQAGLQWDCCLQCLPGRAFIRTAVEYQYWDVNSDVGVQAFSLAQVIPGSNVGSYGAAFADQFLFSLVGFNIGAGIMF